MAALIALVDVTTERCGAADLDRGHGTTLRRRQRGTMYLAIGVAIAAEDDGHRQLGPGHRPEAQKISGRCRWRSGAIGRGNRSKGLAAAQTLLVAICK